jgi:ketosteroid isomerase-like protein
MSEPDDFLSDILPRQIKAEEAIHKGDPEPRLEMWSTGDPVTLFGALGVCKSGTDEVTQTSRWVASLFSNNTSYSFDLVTAGVSGDLAYTAGYERHTTSLDGGPVEPHTLRVTHVYRREDGEWKIVHRHGDIPPVDQSPPAEAATWSQSHDNRSNEAARVVGSLDRDP